MEPAKIAVSRLAFQWLWIALGSFQVTSFVSNFYFHLVLPCDNL